MFEFVRRAKAHPYLERLEVFEVADVVGRCMESWNDAKIAGDIWQTYFPDSDDAKAEFIDTWHKIKWARAALEDARAEAARLPLKPSPCCSAKYAEFVSLAGHLQRAVDGSILLPCLKIASLLDCKPISISRYRKIAIQAGLLKLTSKGVKVQRKADEFRFAVELFDWKTGEQLPSENLNICLTSVPRCYTEIHDIQEIERDKETQENQENQETQEMQRETRSMLPEKRKCTVSRGPYIPTAAELEQDLRKTARFRKQGGMP